MCFQGLSDKEDQSTELTLNWPIPFAQIRHFTVPSILLCYYHNTVDYIIPRSHSKTFKEWTQWNPFSKVGHALTDLQTLAIVNLFKCSVSCVPKQG